MRDCSLGAGRWRQEEGLEISQKKFCEISSVYDGPARILIFAAL